ncbi:MAG: osmoprotectant transporter permease [Spirosoma sp.]|nr:osmoprotectant transporter permease [Spirosoma sp.]
MSLFWVLWGIDVLVALVLVYFFFIGLGDGSVSSFNILLWLAILGSLTAVLVGGYWLFTHQHTLMAKLLLALLAVPSLLYGLFMLIVLMTNPRWN